MSKANNIASLLNSSGAITAEDLNIGQLGGRRNLIINGDMQVAQRGTSETGLTSFGYYTADRFRIGLTGLGTWTQTVENDGPDGFSKSLKMACTTADASPAAGDFLLLGQRFEGQNLQHLKKGTSSAESLTASFWVKSNKTGTYIAEVLDADNSNRHIGKSFTVNSSGTWEYKTVTFEGDIIGALDNDNLNSLVFQIWLGSGSDFNSPSGTLQTSWGALNSPNRAIGNVNLADSTSNYFQITGVQLEVGDTATPFEHRSYGEELALCQRYYCETHASIRGVATSGSQLYVNHIYWPQEMRSAPAATLSGTSTNANDVTVPGATKHGARFVLETASSGGFWSLSNPVTADAEL
jgi:hypothetical protein